MSATFQNSAMVLSIGIFFTLIILGLASSLPATLSHGLIAQGVPRADAARVAALPPVSIMFAALLGYNPVQTLLGPAISRLPASHAAYLTGHTFFPSLISAPFEHGLAIAFDFAIVACLVAAVASLLRGSRYVHEVHGATAVRATAPDVAGADPAPADVIPAGNVAADLARRVAAGPQARQAAARQAGNGHAAAIGRPSPGHRTADRALRNSAIRERALRPARDPSGPEAR